MSELDLVYLFWIFCATLVTYLPLLYYLMAGSTIKGEVERGAIRTPAGFGARYAMFLLSASLTKRKLFNAIVLTSPLTTYWTFSLVLVPQAFLKLLYYSWWFWPLLALRGLTSVRPPEIEGFEEFGEETYRQVLQQENPIAEALVLIRHYEKPPVHRQYIKAKESLLRRDDEVGDVFRAAYARFGDESRGL